MSDEGAASLVAAKAVAEQLDGQLAAFDRSSFAQEKKGKIEETYLTLSELGKGSFGVVSKAKDVRNGDLVAIKTLPKKEMKDPQKIKDEFNVIRQLDHPHICKAFECYEDRKNIYLVMEFLSGGTVLQSLKRQTKFVEADAGHIMRQILSALSYLHQSGFIFRDLKTENVMFISQPIKEEESFWGSPRPCSVREIKLIDFGLCCPFEKGSKMCRAAGTPYSVAPELVTSPIQYDQKCDAWSAGVVMYILLSGKYPFNGKTKEDLLLAIRKEPCRFSQPVWYKVSKQAKNLLAELLHKKANQRISVAEALSNPWLRRKSSLPTEEILRDMMDAFAHFQELNMFEKAAVTALAWRANHQDTAHLRQIFESLDQDGNGHITIQELRGVIEKAGIDIPIDLDLQQLVFQADTDGGGTIEYTEFLAAAMDKQKIIKDEIISEAFRIFDQDGSGTITKQELLKILVGQKGDANCQSGDKNAVNNFVDEYDVSGDAVIDQEEFAEMLERVKQTYRDRKSVCADAAPTFTARAAQKAVRRLVGIEDAKSAAMEQSLLQRFCWCTRLSKDVPETMRTGRSMSPKDSKDSSRKRRSKDRPAARPSKSPERSDPALRRGAASPRVSKRSPRRSLASRREQSPFSSRG